MADPLVSAPVEAPSACARCEARDRAICADLPPDALAAMFGAARSETLRRGETLIWQGDDSLVVANVRSGLLKRTASLDDGREQILGLAFPGDFVGRPHAGTASHCVTALADTQLCVFRRSTFEGLTQCHGSIAEALLRRAFDELDRARLWMLLLGRKSAGERVASLLREFAERGQPRAGGPVPLPINRQQMADLLGLTIETVSRRLTRLKKAGVIDLPDLRSFVVLDPAGLAVEAGD